MRLLIPLLIVLVSATAWAQTAPAGNPAAEPSISTQWNGRAKLTGSRSDYNADTLWGSLKESPYHDGRFNLRINNETFFGAHVYTQVHLETYVTHGDTVEMQNLRAASGANAVPGQVSAGRSETANRHLLDLDTIIKENSDTLVGLRLDRFNFTYEPDWGQVRIGRQAVTWGNGNFFNPMDLCNPFAPTAIDRDYKAGEDMLAATANLPAGPELQLLLVPRREPVSGDVRADQSSLAAKLHWLTDSGSTEFDFLAAVHYEDLVTGLGARGYLGAAAWRLDATWTFLADGDSSGYLSAVANIDYSWVWAGRNFYGLAEIYYNGLGISDYDSNQVDAALSDRLERGEIFTLGRWYLAGTLQMEIHPLVNAFFTSMINVEDPSALLQPYLNWDIKQNLQLTLGAALPLGGRPTEFGGFPIADTTFYNQPPALFFGWATWYF